MTVKELRYALVRYPPDMTVQVAVDRTVNPATQVDVCVDIDNNVKNCVIYGKHTTLNEVVADARAVMDRLYSKMEVAGV